MRSQKDFILGCHQIVAVLPEDSTRLPASLMGVLTHFSEKSFDKFVALKILFGVRPFRVRIHLFRYRVQKSRRRKDFVFSRSQTRRLERTELGAVQ